MDNFTVAAAVFYAIICIHTAGAVKLIRRVGALESRMSVLELQHEDTLKGIDRNTGDITKLNETVSAMDKCTTSDSNRNSDISAGLKEIKKNGNDESGRNLNIFRAFKEEKKQRRIYENRIHKALDEHKKEMKIAALDDKKSINKTINNLSAILNELNLSLSEINKTTTDDIESLQIYIDNIESIVHDIKSTFDDLQNKLDESQKSLTLKHKEDMDSLKSKHKQDMDSLRSSIETLTTEQKRHKAIFSRNCVDGGTRRGDFLYKYITDEATYAGARGACAVCGGHIADVQNGYEMTFVAGLTDKSYWLWLGATDTAREGTWVWDRTGGRAYYTNWSPGEPNNVRQSDGTTEQCLVAGLAGSNLKWRDTRCDQNTFRYVCKYHLA